MRLKRFYQLAMLLALTLVAACGGGSSTNGTIASPVKVGLPSGYTGNFPAYGTYWLDGATVASTLINQNGGILGAQVQLVPEDTGGDTVDGVTAVRQLLAKGINVSVGLAALDYADALPILNKAQMVSFTHIGSPAIDNLTQPYSFSLGPSDAVEGAAFVYYAHQMGYKRIALLFDSSVGAQTFPPTVMHAASVLGLQIVANPAMPAVAPSYTSEIEQIVAAKPDVVISQTEPVQAGLFFSEWSKLGGSNIPMIVSDEDLSTTWGVAAGAAEIASGHVTGIESLATISGSAGAVFSNEYTQLFAVGYGYAAVYAYDGVNIAALAMEAAHSSDPTVYVKYVNQVTDLGSGKTTCFTYATCSALLKAGTKIKYQGLASPDVYNQYHRVTADFGAYTPPTTNSGQPVQVAVIPGTALVPLI
jgi:ABC-type branched-subunit amino acid transport system substrate-binding protein